MGNSRRGSSESDVNCHVQKMETYPNNWGRGYPDFVGFILAMLHCASPPYKRIQFSVNRGNSASLFCFFVYEVDCRQSFQILEQENRPVKRSAMLLHVNVVLM